MLDVTFASGVVRPSNLISQFAAQDLQALPDGAPILFSSSQQFGHVKFGNDSISPSLPEIPNDGEETFDPYPVGVIETVNLSVNNGSVRLATAFLYPTF